MKAARSVRFHCAVVVLLAACSSGLTGPQGATEPAPTDAPGVKVPGTSAQVNDEKVSPLHEGQYIGQLEPTKRGGCRGSSGSSATGSIGVTLRIDESCRVFVDSIDP